ncbi:MAG TPA: DUF4272 domain-containing protein [Tepidisphaeraceae bacterium]|nr:DUF4272 domain-containing protein [Tepidisphaeraceae bacterium]
METPPITIYAHRIDPAGVLQTLRAGGAAAVEVDEPGSAVNWGRATARLPGGAVVVRHDPDYYGGDDWGRQMLGMQGYLGRFPGGDDAAVRQTVAAFRFAVSVTGEPPLAWDSDDPRLAVVRAVARHLDGVIFVPGYLLDAAGRVLVSATGEYDPDAVYPASPTTGARPTMADPTAHGAADDDDEEDETDDEDDDEEDDEPPTTERVARRACALAAVGGRALLEQEDAADPGVERTRQAILAWVDDIGIGDELEPDEWEVLQRPLGRLTQQQAINGSWRIEGLAVLAWALRRFDLPPHDEICDPGKLLPALGILNAPAARAMIAEPALRPPEEIQRMAARLLGIHWRVRDFSLRPQTMDFAAFARDSWFGEFELDGIAMADGDLAIAGLPIAAAAADALARTSSAAMERHLAVNWLRGFSAVYSETDTST